MASPRLLLQCEQLSPTAYLPEELSKQIWKTLGNPNIPTFVRVTLHAISELADPRAGAARPVPLDDIRGWALDVMGQALTERTIKLAVKLLVEKYGVAIGSSRGAQHGYFFITTDDEARRAAAPLIGEIKSLARRCRTFTPKNPYIQHLLGQLEVL